MKKALFFSTLYLFACCSGLVAQEITGFWKSLNDKTQIIQCVIAVYEYKDKYYGRIIGTYDDNGKLVDDIHAPTFHAPGVAGHPYYAGLDLIWNLRQKGSKFKGKIIDPQKGGVYNSVLWIRDGNLIVRGELLVFGRNTTWYPIEAGDFPEGYKMPDVASFVPVIPEGV